MGGVHLAWGVASDVGLTRRVNEDAVLAEPPIFLVADGMGGHDAGDVASALVTEHLRGLLAPSLLSVRSITEAIEGANEEIVRRGLESGNRLAMGTTVVGAALVDNGGAASWLVFNLGDSRIYRNSEGVLRQVSVDHSYVQELMDSGVIDAEGARTHPQRNVVTRALGMESGAEVDVWFLDPEPGERLIICSDGLSSEIDDDAIAAVAEGLDPADAADALVRAALEAGGRDNVSVVVVDVVQVDRLEAVEVDTAPRSVGVTEAPSTLEALVVPGATVTEPVAPIEVGGLISVPVGLVSGGDSPLTNDGGDAGSGDGPAVVASQMIDGVPPSLTTSTSTRSDAADSTEVEQERTDK